MSRLAGEIDWGAAIGKAWDRRVLALLFLGFSAGVPILLIFSTLSIWLREADVSRATIGFFSWAALGYGFKFVWAPLIDRLPVPVLGRLMGHRRSWLLVTQASVIAAIAFMALTNPAQSLTAMAAFAILLGFSSASQDIVIDAYRIEIADRDLQALLSAAYIAGYRIGMVVAGFGALELAGLLDVIEGYDYNAWRLTYLAMAGAMLVGVATTFVIREPEREPTDGNLETTSDYARFLLAFAVVVGTFIAGFFLTGDIAAALKSGPVTGFLAGLVRLVGAVALAGAAGWTLVRAGLVPEKLMRETYLGPFLDFFRHYGKPALLILCLIATYRIADIVMGVMANVFYVDLGFEKQEIGRVSKFYGLLVTLVGNALGGLLVVRFGVIKTLFLGGVLAAVTNLIFAVMAGMGSVMWMLFVAIGADNLAAGIATTAFVAYLSGLTHRTFTASQYALFSSIMVILPKVIAGYSGTAVESVGYAPFFIGTAILGVIPLVLIVVVRRQIPRE